MTVIDAYVSRNVPAAAPAHHGRVRDQHGEEPAKGDPVELDVVKDSAKAMAAEAVERVKGALGRGLIAHGAYPPNEAM